MGFDFLLIQNLFFNRIGLAFFLGEELVNSLLSLVEFHKVRLGIPSFFKGLSSVEFQSLDLLPWVRSSGVKRASLKLW